MGRAKYKEWVTEEGLLQLGAWARNGLTLAEIAKNMGISMSTLSEWRLKMPEISEALKKNREVADIIVENALFNNATGYSYIEQVSATKKEVFYEDGKRLKEVTTPIALDLIRHKPPETTAQIYYLKNRKPVDWRDKREVPQEEPEQNKALAVLANIGNRRAESGLR